MKIDGISSPITNAINGALTQAAASGADFHSVMAHVTADDKIGRTAKQFEALMIGQILKSAQPGDEGIFGGGADQAGSIAIEMAQEQFAQAMASRGGLGIAKLVEKGLRHSKSSNSAALQP